MNVTKIHTNNLLKKYIGYLIFFGCLTFLLGSKVTFAQDFEKEKRENRKLYMEWYKIEHYSKFRHLLNNNLAYKETSKSEKSEFAVFTFLGYKYSVLRKKKLKELLLLIGVNLGSLVLFFILTHIIAISKKNILENIFTDCYDAFQTFMISEKNKKKFSWLKYFKSSKIETLYHYLGAGIGNSYVYKEKENENSAAFSETILLFRLIMFYIVNLSGSTAMSLTLPLDRLEFNIMLALLGMVHLPMALAIRIFLKVIGMWSSHIFPLFNYYILRNSIPHTYDEMEEMELLYIRNLHRLPESLLEFIEKELIKARNYPKERLAIFLKIETIVGLPTLEEVEDGLKLNDEADLSFMKNYGSEEKDAMERIYFRRKNGGYGTNICLLGESGVGKTRSIIEFSKIFDIPIAKISLAGVTVKELVGYPSEDGKDGFLGIIGTAIQKIFEETGIAPLLFIDEIDKVESLEVLAKCLELFESNTRSYASPYLEGLEIALPSIVIFAANKRFGGAFENRLEIVEYGGFSWQTKHCIVYGTEDGSISYEGGELDNYCDIIGIERESLTEEDYRNINAILEEMEKAEKNGGEIDVGMRSLEKRILSYLFRYKKNKAQFIKLKKKFKKMQRTLPGPPIIF